jgi:hypothetical protein
MISVAELAEIASFSAVSSSGGTLPANFAPDCATDSNCAGGGVPHAARPANSRAEAILRSALMILPWPDVGHSMLQDALPDEVAQAHAQARERHGRKAFLIRRSLQEIV